MHMISGRNISVSNETHKTTHATMQCSILLLCTFCFLLGATWGNQDPGPELLVSTTLGTLSGSHLTSRSGRTFAAFRGVPYAKPPVADLRFKVHRPIIEIGLIPTISFI